MKPEPNICDCPKCGDTGRIEPMPFLTYCDCDCGAARRYLDQQILKEARQVKPR